MQGGSPFGAGGAGFPDIFEQLFGGAAASMFSRVMVQPIRISFMVSRVITLT